MMPTASPTLDEATTAAALAALGNPTRIRIFRLLVRAGPAGLSVGEVQSLLDVPASTLSHHLAALVRVNLVEQERSGREIRCRAGYAAMNDLVAFLTRECCRGVSAAG